MAEPMKRAKAITEFADSLAKALHGRSNTESVKANKCVPCGGEAVEFRDECSRREYRISGLCQKCQDDFFGGPEDELHEEGV